MSIIVLIFGAIATIYDAVVLQYDLIIGFRTDRPVAKWTWSPHPNVSALYLCVGVDTALYLCVGVDTALYLCVGV